MMASAQQFPFVPRDPSLGHASLAPLLPLTLTGTQSAVTSGLVDSGAAINVLPYSLGLQLGLDWARQTRSVGLSGNLAPVEARVVVLSAVVASFPAVRLAFAWAQRLSGKPLSPVLGGEGLLGQTLRPMPSRSFWDRSTSSWNLMFASTARAVSSMCGPNPELPWSDCQQLHPPTCPPAPATP
jgi:hypothetical protein